MEYIEREAAVNGLAKVINESCMPEDWDKGIRDAMLALLIIPAADVRPVVLCKDCRHRDPKDGKCDAGAVERAGCAFPVGDNYFCSYGEKREES